jgi:hypothetical protein
VCPDGVGRITVNGQDPLVTSLTLAESAWVAGYPDRAIDLIESAIKRSSDLNQPLSMATALNSAKNIRFWRREVLEIHRLCEQLEALAEERGFSSWLAMNRIYQGWVRHHPGRTGTRNRADSQRHC